VEEKRIGRFTQDVEENCPELEEKRNDFRRKEEGKQTDNMKSSRKRRKEVWFRK
jgi:hypothetical protein